MIKDLEYEMAQQAEEWKSSLVFEQGLTRETEI